MTRVLLTPLAPVWSPLPRYLSPLADKIASILESWKGTPYMPGQNCKQGGIDCVRFVTGFLEELTGTPSKPSLRIPQDACMHSRPTAMRALRYFLQAWPDHEDVLQEGRAEPGDVLVVGPRNGGPGHAMIVGPERNQVWHSSAGGVARTGWCLTHPMAKLFRVYRGTDRESWL